MSKKSSLSKVEKLSRKLHKLSPSGVKMRRGDEDGVVVVSWRDYDDQWHEHVGAVEVAFADAITAAGKLE